MIASLFLGWIACPVAKTFLNGYDRNGIFSGVSAEVL